MQLDRYHADDRTSIVRLFKDVFSEADGASEGEAVSKLVEAIMSETTEESYLGFTVRNGDELCGAIFFTPLYLETKDFAYLLSPVAIATRFQKQGLGKKLINYGIDELKRRGASLLFTYGDPNYYTQFGFNQISDEFIVPPYALSQPEGWLAQSLEGRELKASLGKMRCVKAFDNPALW